MLHQDVRHFKKNSANLSKYFNFGENKRKREKEENHTVVPPYPRFHFPWFQLPVVPVSSIQPQLENINWKISEVIHRI